MTLPDIPNIFGNQIRILSIKCNHTFFRQERQTLEQKQNSHPHKFPFPFSLPISSLSDPPGDWTFNPSSFHFLFVDESFFLLVHCLISETFVVAGNGASEWRHHISEGQPLTARSTATTKKSFFMFLRPSVLISIVVPLALFGEKVGNRQQWK